MGNLWLKIKVWTKGIVVALITIYGLLFVYNNSADATVWWWFNRTFKSTTVLLILIAFLLARSAPSWFARPCARFAKCAI